MVRGHLHRERYRAKFHDATLAVLAAYDHHERVGRRLRVDFHEEGMLQVRIESPRPQPAMSKGGPPGTGALSLSRSQLFSVSFALAVAANLGHVVPRSASSAWTTSPMRST